MPVFDFTALIVSQTRHTVKVLMYENGKEATKTVASFLYLLTSLQGRIQHKRLAGIDVRNSWIPLQGNKVKFVSGKRKIFQSLGGKIKIPELNFYIFLLLRRTIARTINAISVIRTAIRRSAT